MTAPPETPPAPDEPVTDQAYREMRARLRAFIARRVADPETAEDLTQDVLLRLVRHQGDDVDDLVAWLYRVARNALVDHYRRRPEPEPLGADQRPLSRAVTDPFAEDPRESSRELAQCLPPLVDRLAEPYRSAVRAVDLEGATHAAAASLAGISTPGMKSRVQRGRRQLKQLLSDCCTVELSVTGMVTDYRAPSGCAPGHCA